MSNLVVSGVRQHLSAIMRDEDVGIWNALLGVRYLVLAYRQVDNGLEGFLALAVVPRVRIAEQPNNLRGGAPAGRGCERELSAGHVGPFP
jgi:hypothetical protein